MGFWDFFKSNNNAQSKAIAEVLLDALKKTESSETDDDDDGNSRDPLDTPILNKRKPQLKRTAARQFIASVDKLLKSLDQESRDCFRHIVYNCNYKDITTTYFCGMEKQLKPIIKSGYFTVTKHTANNFKDLRAAQKIVRNQIYTNQSCGLSAYKDNSDICALDISNPTFCRTAQILYFHICKIDEHNNDLDVTEDELDEYVYHLISSD